MPENNTNYSQLLRPVGQMLEALGVESFSLKVEGDDVLVMGKKRPEPVRAVQETSLRVVWQLLRGKSPEPREEARPSSGVIELRYSPDDIERLEVQGQAKRGGSGSAPEAHSPSQILRAVGAFVDQKEGRFLGVKKENRDITIDYQSISKQKVSEQFTVSSLYDYWVNMYLKRKARGSRRN